MLELYAPRPDELRFRQRLLNDPATMAYNRAWGGTIPFPESQWADWYARWTEDGEHFYRYLRDAASGAFVGEAAYHRDAARGLWLADVIVAAEHRGKGCGTEGLRLLCAAAAQNGIDVLWDDIAADNPAVRLFLRAGFAAERRTAEAVTLKKVLAPPVHRAIVVGSPGAGKSTFARRLRDRTGLPLYYLDRFFHRPDRTTASRGEFDARLGAVLAEERWVIDGNYRRTLTERFERCTDAFFFDLPADVCLQGAAARIGRPREDMPWVERELDPEFRQYILDFPAQQLPQLRELAERYRASRRVRVFHTRAEADAWLDAVFGAPGAVDTGAAP